MPTYIFIRCLHAGCAGLNIGLFLARGSMQIANVNWRRWRWLRVAPHINDTLLLGAALTLAGMSGQYPITNAWLTAKVVALIAYIVLGALALREDVPPRTRKICFVLALVTVTYIVGVAFTKSAAWGLPHVHQWNFL